MRDPFVRCAILASVPLSIQVASAGEVETRWMIEGDHGTSFATGDDTLADLTVGLGAGALRLTLQARSHSPEGLGFMAVRGGIHSTGLGVDDARGDFEPGFGGVEGRQTPDQFSASRLWAISAPGTPPDPAEFGQGVFIDVLSFDFEFVAASDDAFVFRYDPTDVVDNQPQVIMVEAWNYDELLSEAIGFDAWTSDWRRGFANASSVTITVPAPPAALAGALALACLSARGRRT